MRCLICGGAFASHAHMVPVYGYSDATGAPGPSPLGYLHLFHLTDTMNVVSRKLGL